MNITNSVINEIKEHALKTNYTNTEWSKIQDLSISGFYNPIQILAILNSLSATSERLEIFININPDNTLNKIKKSLNENAHLGNIQSGIERLISSGLVENDQYGNFSYTLLGKVMRDILEILDNIINEVNNPVFEFSSVEEINNKIEGLKLLSKANSEAKKAAEEINVDNSEYLKKEIEITHRITELEKIEKEFTEKNFGTKDNTKMYHDLTLSDAYEIGAKLVLNDDKEVSCSIEILTDIDLNSYNVLGYENASPNSFKITSNIPIEIHKTKNQQDIFFKTKIKLSDCTEISKNKLVMPSYYIKPIATGRNIGFYPRVIIEESTSKSKIYLDITSRPWFLTITG